MVAVGSPRKKAAGRSGCRRLSPPTLILCVLGVSIVYVLVLLSFATKIPTRHGEKKENADIARLSFGASKSLNKRENSPKPNEIVRRAEPPTIEETTTKIGERMKATNEQEGKQKAPGGEQAVVPSGKPRTDKASAETQPRRTTRGRSNFRNVVIPNLSNQEKGMKPGWMEKPRGEGVKPQVILPTNVREEVVTDLAENHPDPANILKAYIEPIDFKEWESKPLPIRSTATSDQLEEISFPLLNSCNKLPEMIPVDQYPDHDPFLPWIHDVFPTSDGKFIQFVAQNRRRCHTGKTTDEKELLHLTQPNIALFQHVPVKRIEPAAGNEIRYRLSSHEEADPDGMATRFICRFKPSMEETLSVYNFDYDYATHRKRQKNTFQYKDGGILSVHLSQFIFRCPVPATLVDIVKSGKSVKNDWATLFVDLVPIRTPPRYGLANAFLQPHYSERLPDNIEDRFDPHKEWGSDHLLPRIEDSGRWENIPICKPTLKAYYPSTDTLEQATNGDAETDTIPKDLTSQNDSTSQKGFTKHRLVACMWASAGYSTRGNRFAVNDGQRRMLEWIQFNKLLGFEHFYLYDNSYAFSDEITLKPIADLFPDEITYIKWPFQVCNNNPNNVDSPGERSSQYAAESSCRLRFGPHVEWIGQFDLDEYLVPMGNYTSMLPILDKLDSEGKKILSFGSWRAWPRRDYIEEPVPIRDPSLCNNNHACFDLQVPLNRTVLQTYNCDRQSGPKKAVMPAEKQVYRPDYVLQHFIHYSSVTVLSQLSKSEFEKAGYDWFKTRMAPDPHSRFSDETNEATMLHTKAIARQDTAGWLDICKATNKKTKTDLCRVGVPFPDDYDEDKDGEADGMGWKYNCYVNQKTEHFWTPLLQKTLDDQGHLLAGS